MNMTMLKIILNLNLSKNDFLTLSLIAIKGLCFEYELYQPLKESYHCKNKMHDLIICHYSILFSQLNLIRVIPPTPIEKFSKVNENFKNIF